jgi:hypothetical protein
MSSAAFFVGYLVSRRWPGLSFVAFFLSCMMAFAAMAVAMWLAARADERSTE